MFSIVVPCVDRDLAYLENCLKGLLLQSYSNFELIVIFNLRKRTVLTDTIIRKFKKEKKIKFFFNKKYLTINKNFENGLNFTTKKWVIYCSADDCMPSESLELISNIIKKKKPKLVCWNYSGISYNHDNNLFFYTNDHKKNINYYSIKTTDVLENILKDDMLVSRHKNILPFIPRAAFNKSIVNSKKIFGKSDPMIYSGLYNLTAVDSYYYIDQPLLIAGEAKNSISQMHNENYLFSKVKKNKSVSEDLNVEYTISKKIFCYLKKFPFYSSNRMIHLSFLFSVFNILPKNNKKKLFFFNKFNIWKKSNHSNFLLSVFEEFQIRKNNLFFIKNFLINFELIKALFKRNNFFSFLRFFYLLIIIFLITNLRFFKNKLTNKLTKKYINFDNMFMCVKFIKKNYCKNNLNLIYKGDYFEKNSTYR